MLHARIFKNQEFTARRFKGGLEECVRGVAIQFGVERALAGGCRASLLVRGRDWRRFKKNSLFVGGAGGRGFFAYVVLFWKVLYFSRFLVVEFCRFCLFL